MSAFVVLCTRLDQLRADGSEKKHYRGDVVTDLSDDDVERHLASGNIGRKRDDESDAAVEAAEAAAALEEQEATAAAAVAAAEAEARLVAGLGGPDDAPPPPAPVLDVPTHTDVLERPKQANNVGVWRDYAVASGRFDQVTADGMSKKALMEALA